MYAVTRGPCDVGAWILAAAAYSGAAVTLTTALGAPPPALRHTPAKGGCENCSR